MSGLIASTGHSGYAHPAVDALVGVDDEHVLAFVEAVDGAHRDAIGGLALDAPFIDDVGHSPFRCKERLGLLSLSSQVGLGRDEPLAIIQGSGRLGCGSV